MGKSGKVAVAVGKSIRETFLLLQNQSFYSFFFLLEVQPNEFFIAK